MFTESICISEVLIQSTFVLCGLVVVVVLGAVAQRLSEKSEKFMDVLDDTVIFVVLVVLVLVFTSFVADLTIEAEESVTTEEVVETVVVVVKPSCSPRLIWGNLDKQAVMADWE